MSNDNITKIIDDFNIAINQLWEDYEIERQKICLKHAENIANISEVHRHELLQLHEQTQNKSKEINIDKQTFMDSGN